MTVRVEMHEQVVAEEFAESRGRDDVELVGEGAGVEGVAASEEVMIVLAGEITPHAGMIEAGAFTSISFGEA